MSNKPTVQSRMVPTRHLFTFTRGYPIGRGDLGKKGTPCIHYGDIHGSFGFNINLESASIGRLCDPDRFGVQNFVSKGDFLFAGTSEDLNGSGNFTLVTGEEIGIAGSDTIVLRPVAPLNSRYFAYLFDSLYFREQIRPHMMGTKVFHPTQRVIKQAVCIVPKEQVASAIVSYLDSVTESIDSLIGRLTYQVELLERYRRELIARTVTRGLNPNAEMRDSGIPWIGKVPASWEQQSLKTVLRRKSLRNRPDWRVLSVERRRGVVDRESQGSTSNHNRLPDDLSSYLVVEAGQFVMNKMKAWSGAYGVSELDGIVSPAYYTFDLQVSNPSFFNWAIRSTAYIPFFAKDSYGIRVDQWDFKASALRLIPFFFPSENEQAAIVKFLERKTKAIDAAIVGIGAEIRLLLKYRKQVIDDAVTGKVRLGELL